MNNRLDARFKKLDGCFKALWCAYKNSNSDPGRKKAGLARHKTKQIAREVILARGKRDTKAGDKRTHSELQAERDFCNEATATHLSNNLLE